MVDCSRHTNGSGSTLPSIRAERRPGRLREPGSLPHLANDTESTLNAARWFGELVERPNLMIKLPGTLEGLPAMEQLIAEGSNVNVTLLFSVERYGRSQMPICAACRDT